MRWIIEALKAFMITVIETSVVNPRSGRGMYVVMLMFALIAGGLLLLNPAKFWWAPKALIVAGVVIFLLLIVGILALGNQIAGGSGTFGGRTGVMLKDLEEGPPEDPKRKKKATIRRDGDTVPDWKIRTKAAAADAILDFLSETDRAFEHARLTRTIEDTASQVRAAMESGDLKSAAARLTSACKRKLATELYGGKRPRFQRVTTAAVRFIRIVAPTNDSDHTVTAMVTLHLFDKKKNEIVATQSFWKFRRDGSKWRVDAIQKSEDVDDVCAVTSTLAAKQFERFRKVASSEVLFEVSSSAN